MDYHLYKNAAEIQTLSLTYAICSLK